MPRTDRASRVMAAPPGRVWAALVDPEALMAWLPPGEMKGRAEHSYLAARNHDPYRVDSDTAVPLASCRGLVWPAVGPAGGVAWVV